jgi:MFS family permease
MVVGSALTPRFGRDTMRLLRVMAAAEIVLAVGLMGAGVSPVWPLAAIAFVVGGLGNGALSVACRTIVTLRVPDEYRGRAFGVMTGAINAGSVVAFAAGGALVAALAPRVAIVGCAGAALAVGLVFAAYTRRSIAFGHGCPPHRLADRPRNGLPQPRRVRRPARPGGRSRRGAPS